jgi:hypothetical protein
LFSLWVFIGGYFSLVQGRASLGPVYEAGLVHFCAVYWRLCCLRKGFGDCPGLLPFGRDGAHGLVDDKFGGIELEAGGSFVVAEDIADSLVGEVGHGHGFFAVQEIAFGKGLLEGSFEMRKIVAPAEDILEADVGAGGGLVDGVAGADRVDDGLLGRGKFDLAHENLIPDNTIAGERAEAECGNGVERLGVYETEGVRQAEDFLDVL